MVLVGLSLIVPAANADQQYWRGAVIVADGRGPGADRGRRWNELNTQEKQRIYRQHKKWQGWSLEQQRSACIDYYRHTRRVPKACEPFELR